MQSITLIVYRLGNTMPFPLLPLNLVDWVPASHTSISSYYPIGWLPVLSYYPELLWAGCPYLMPPITLIPNMFEPVLKQTTGKQHCVTKDVMILHIVSLSQNYLTSDSVINSPGQLGYLRLISPSKLSPNTSLS